MKIVLSLIAFLYAFQTLVAEEVRLLDLEPPDAHQVIEKHDQSLHYAPKVDSSVPAVRYLGNEPHDVQEDIYLARQYHGQDGLGGYLYGYNIPDIAKTEKKEAHGDLTGAYNYISQDGQEIKVQYWDDGTGFHQIDNVPQILPKQIDDSPEVKAEKEKFLARWHEEAERNQHPVTEPYDSNGNYASGPLSLQGQLESKKQSANLYPQGSSSGVYQQTGQYQSTGQYKPPGPYNQQSGSSIQQNGAYQQSGQYQHAGQYQQPLHSSQSQQPGQYQQSSLNQQPGQYQQFSGNQKPGQNQLTGQYQQSGQAQQSGLYGPKYQAGQGQPGNQLVYSNQNLVPSSNQHTGQYQQSSGYQKPGQYGLQQAKYNGQPDNQIDNSGQYSENQNIYSKPNYGSSNDKNKPGQYDSTSSSSQYSQQTDYSKQNQLDNSGQYEEKSEEENGPPKGFFYSYDYPVGKIVRVGGIARVGDLKHTYDENKSKYESQLRAGHSNAHSTQSSYLYS